MKSFDDFLEKRFPDSRRKAYYLMAMHENLTRVPEQQLREIGWTKARELAKIARREGQRFEAQEFPKEEFKREVEHLTGRNTEASELLCFRLVESQLAVIEQALETASLMLGSDKSRGYCLEMICADFLAGANLQEGNPDILVLAVRRLVEMLPTGQREQVLQEIGVQRDGWRCQQCGS